MTAPRPPDSTQRKRVELLAKLENLIEELDRWVEVSEPAAALEKHHTQIRRIDRQLRSVGLRLQEDIRSADVGRDWRRLERQTLDLHRVWDFFREKFALRFVPWLQPYLIMADEFAWACYEPVQKLAVEEGVVAAGSVREPPLVCLTAVSTPYSIPRGASYAADVGGGAALSTAARQLVSRLPVPVVGVPWFQLRHLPDALIIGHEVGHHVFRDFGLRPDAERLVDGALAEAGLSESGDRWRGWLEESFADVYGVLSAGSAYPLALGDFLLVEGLDARTDEGGGYPPSATRLALTLAALDHAGRADAVPRLRELWGRSQLPDVDADVVRETDAVAGALVEGCYKVLGRPLGRIIDCTEQCRAADMAADVLDGWAPDTSDIRTVLAAAAHAFAWSPTGYQDASVTELILEVAGDIQQPGFRFRGGGAQARDEEAVGLADDAAGDELYDLLG